VRIDLIVVYHGDRMARAEHVDSTRPRQRPELEHYLFRFEDSGSKRRALAAVVRIT
jgi:hypothetical protein